MKFTDSLLLPFIKQILIMTKDLIYRNLIFCKSRVWCHWINGNLLLPETVEPESAFCSDYNLPETLILPAGISARRPEISLRASAQREVESAIMLTLYPMSLKYSDSVIPAQRNWVSMQQQKEGEEVLAYSVIECARYLCRWRLLWQLQACWRCWQPVQFSSWCSPSSRPPP